MNPLLQAKTELVVGNQAPDFKLFDEAGNGWQLIKHRGNVVVLYFYPMDDTPGCTKQACSLRDNYDAFKKLGATVVGINYNSSQSHKAFKAKHHLPFTLLSDHDKKVAKLYNAKPWWAMWFWAIPKRKTIVIDQAGVTRSILDDVDVTTHTEEVLSEVRKLGIVPQ